MKKGTILIGIIWIVLWMQCARQVNHTESYATNNGTTFDIPAYGTDSTLEIATWNLLNFPIADGNIDGSPDPGREEYFEKLLLTEKIDIIGVEEVNYPQNLQKIIDKYDSIGIFLSDENVSQHVGVIYNKVLFEKDPSKPVTLLFENEHYIFPRAPLSVPFRIINNGENFNFIVLHLKARTDQQSQSRREQAINMLYDYVKQQEQNGEKFVIVGDFNSDMSNEPFLKTTFVNDPDFVVLTYDSLQPNESYYASYPSYSSLIDHIIISKNLLNLIHLLDVETLRIDDYLKDYLSVMSDHRPVAIKFTTN